jgi:hypothetical protein
MLASESLIDRSWVREKVSEFKDSWEEDDRDYLLKGLVDNCLNCGKEFVLCRPDQKYCSRKCFYESKMKDTIESDD